VPKVTPTSLNDRPYKLLLLSSDKSEEATLNCNLSNTQGFNYSLLSIEALDKLKQFELQSLCNAVLLDLRIDHQVALDSIRYLAENKGPIALICLCQNHSQLHEFKDIMYLIDDYILAESLTNGELPTRITHAIRRCRKEHELLTEQNLLKALLDNIPDAVYFKDTKSRFTKVNRAMADSYGHSEPDRIIGKSDFDLFTKEHAQPAYDDEQKIISTGDPLIGKIEKETLANGDVKWVTTTKLPLRDKHGTIIGTMGISRSITDLKEAQEHFLEKPLCSKRFSIMPLQAYTSKTAIADTLSSMSVMPKTSTRNALKTVSEKHSKIFTPQKMRSALWPSTSRS